MSLIKDLSDSSDGIKSVAVNAFLIPFWYVVIYIFHQEFFINNDFLLIIAFCICLTLVPSILLVFSLHELRDVSKAENVTIFDPGISTLSLFIQIIWISLLSFFGYLWKFFFCEILLFVPFLLIYLFPIFFIVMYALAKANKEEQNKKS